MANLYMQNTPRFSRPGSRFKWSTPAPGAPSGPLPVSAAPTGVGPSTGSQSMSQGNQHYTQPTLNTNESYAPPTPQAAPMSAAPAPTGMPVTTTNAAFADPMAQRQMLSDIHGYSPPNAANMLNPDAVLPRMDFSPLVPQANLQNIIARLTGRRALHSLSGYRRNSGSRGSRLIRGML